MADIKVTLSIGISNAYQSDILHIESDEWDKCKTDKEKNDLMESYWQLWANDFIDGGCVLL